MGSKRLHGGEGLQAGPEYGDGASFGSLGAWVAGRGNCVGMFCHVTRTERKPERLQGAQSALTQKALVMGIQVAPNHCSCLQIVSFL